MSANEGGDCVEKIEVHLVDLAQDRPYLGSLREGESANEFGYFVRRGNRTVYPLRNRSLVVRALTRDGVEGWGETYGLVAPKATAEIINDLLAGFVVGRDPGLVEELHDELYDLMRVRGYIGGFYLDALAALDIALWDIAGKLAGVPVARLLAPESRAEIPAYLSGLPEDSLAERCALAARWQGSGFDSFKFALPVADDGPVAELAALRERLGEQAQIACDLHWAFAAEEAIALAGELAPNRPWFLEAPVAPEDLEGLCAVADQSGQQIAVGEEWRTLFDARLRLDRKGCHIVQPEMGHTGITQFVRIARHAAACGVALMPHATIGAGVFLAASLQAAAALPGLVAHEYQHSVFDSFRSFTGDALACRSGTYTVPGTPGLGVEPSAEMRAAMTLLPA